MKITVLGSCSGTEPFSGCHQTSVAVETGGRVYFIRRRGKRRLHLLFGGCSPAGHRRHLHHPHPHGPHRRTAPPAVEFPQAVHHQPGHRRPHGGPGDSGPHAGPVRVRRGHGHAPGSEGNYETNFHLDPHLLRDGVAYDQNGFKLTAYHNYHLGEPSPGLPWLSYTFVVEAEGKKVLFSGDFRDFSEIAPQMEGCDLVFLETGHHTAAALCQELKDSGIQVGKVVFYHHGLEILKRPGRRAGRRQSRAGRPDDLLQRWVCLRAVTHKKAARGAPFGGAPVFVLPQAGFSREKREKRFLFPAFPDKLPVLFPHCFRRKTQRTSSKPLSSKRLRRNRVPR